MEQQPEKNENKTLMIGVIVVVSLLLIAIIVVCITALIMFNGVKNADNSNTTSQTTEVSEITTTEEQLTEAKTVETPTTEAQTSDNQDSAKKEDNTSKGDISLISNRDYVAIGSQYGIDNIYADISIKNDGSFSGTEIVKEEPPSTVDFSGKFGDVTKGEDLIYLANIEQVDPSWWQEMDYAQFYDKGLPISYLPDYIKNYIRDGHYGQLVDSNSLPCMIIYNSHIKAVYAEKDYINTLVPDNSSNSSTSSNMGPFYGIWCYGSKNESDADSFASDLISKGYDGRVFVTTDWDNLNTEKYYVVTAGVYSTESEAKNKLDSVQSSGYGDAYVKYSGEYIGN